MVALVMANAGLYWWPAESSVYASVLNRQERGRLAPVSQLAITATISALPAFELRAVAGTPVPLPRETPRLVSDVTPAAQPTAALHIEATAQSEPDTGELTQLSAPTVQYLKDVVPDGLSPESLQQAGLANLLQSGSSNAVSADPDDEPVLDDFAGDEQFEENPTPSETSANRPRLTLLPDENEAAAPVDLSLLDTGDEATAPAPAPPAAPAPAVESVDLSVFPADIPEPEEPFAADSAAVADPQLEIEAATPAFEFTTPPEVSTSTEPDNPHSTPVVPQPEPPIISPEPAPFGKDLFAACGQKIRRHAVIDICSMVFIARRYGSGDAAADVTADGLVDEADLAMLAEFYKQPVLLIWP